MKKHRPAGAKKSFTGVLLFGVAFSFVLLFIISLILSGLIMTTSNPTGSVKTVSLAALLLSGAVSGFVIAKIKGDGGFIATLCSSLVFIGIILAVSLICSHGQVSGVIFMNGLCYTMISVFFSFLAKKRQRRHRR